MATAPTTEQLQATAPHGYPVTDDGWVTFTRVRHPQLGVLLVQRRDGCSRTVRA